DRHFQPHRGSVANRLEGVQGLLRNLHHGALRCGERLLPLNLKPDLAIENNPINARVRMETRADAVARGRRNVLSTQVRIGEHYLAPARLLAMPGAQLSHFDNRPIRSRPSILSDWPAGPVARVRSLAEQCAGSKRHGQTTGQAFKN